MKFKVNAYYKVSTGEISKDEGTVTENSRCQLSEGLGKPTERKAEVGCVGREGQTGRVGNGSMAHAVAHRVDIDVLKPAAGGRGLSSAEVTGYPKLSSSPIPVNPSPRYGPANAG